MKLTFKEWVKVLVLLLDEAAAIVLVLLILQLFNINIPLPIMITLGIIMGIIAFLFHRALVPSFRRKQVTGVEGLIGLEGEVTQPLAPLGMVKVQGEYWQARADTGNIPIGQAVEVTGSHRLTLTVKPIEKGE